MAEVSREVVDGSSPRRQKDPELRTAMGHDIDVLVTDKGLSDELVAKIESHQVRVIRA